MKKTIILFSAICFLLTTCSRKEYIDSLNKVPVLTFENFPDSIKIGFPIDLEYSIEDIDFNFNHIQYNGAGLNLTNIPNEKNYFNGSYIFNSTLNASSSGNLKIEFNTKDEWGGDTTIIKQITSFVNLPPIAVYDRIKLNESNGQVTYKFILTDSYDQDEAYGGEVVYYEFFVDGQKLPAIIEEPGNYFFTFDENNSYNLTYRVRDNSDDYSEEGVINNFNP